MFDDDPRPFWFTSPELLAELYRSEVNIVARLHTENPEWPKLFDSPEATLPQRSTGFALLAHRELMRIIDETFVGRYEQSPSLGEIETNVLQRTRNLVAPDAPAWVLEMNQVVESLPFRILKALPEPLQSEGWYTNDSEKEDEAKRSAAMTLSTVEQIQRLTKHVIDQQWERLAARWPVTVPVVNQPRPDQHPRTTRETLGGQTRRFNKRKGWEQKLKLYNAIQNILDRNPSLEGIEFCAELDKRHAPPLYDWVKTREWREGFTWKEAWKDRKLRRKIRRVRQEAMKGR